MPNAAPPRSPALRRRTATQVAVRTATTGTSGSGAAAASEPVFPAPDSGEGAVPAGLPSSWAGFSALLAGVSDRLPADALTLSTNASSDGAGPTRIDLTGMWATAAQPAAPRSQLVIRALDAKGRLMLPVTLPAGVRLPAERDGAVITLFLPGAPGAPRPGYAAVGQPLDARGRLTLTAGLRREAGIPDGADVLAVHDATALTVTVVAASRFDDLIGGVLDSLRRRTVPTETPAAQHLNFDSPSAPAPAAGRLRIVG